MCPLGPLAYTTVLHLGVWGAHPAQWADGLSPTTVSPRSYSLGPEVQFFVDQLDELRVAEGEEVDDLVDSSQKLIPPKVSLQGQVRGGASSAAPKGKTEGISIYLGWLRGHPRPRLQQEGQRLLTLRMGRMTFSLKFFEMVILSLIWTSPVETESCCLLPTSRELWDCVCLLALSTKRALVLPLTVCVTPAKVSGSLGLDEVSSPKQ